MLSFKEYEEQRRAILEPTLDEAIAAVTAAIEAGKPYGVWNVVDKVQDAAIRGLRTAWSNKNVGGNPPLPPDKRTLSERLRDQIREYGPANVAAETGINKSVISRFLAGKTITLETAEKILESLGSN